VMPEILSLPLPVLVSLTFFGGLVFPTCSPPKFKAVGNKLGVGVLKYKKTGGARAGEGQTATRLSVQSRDIVGYKAAFDREHGAYGNAFSFVVMGPMQQIGCSYGKPETDG
jgi:hypothetical protein